MFDKLHEEAKHPNKVQATALMAPTLWLNGWMIRASAGSSS